MRTETISDEDILSDVSAELFFDPQVTTNNIHVHVTNGRVTLTGVADTYSTKWAAQRAAYREHGVRGVDNLVSIDANLLGLPDDVQLGAAVRHALNFNATVPADSIHVFVLDGDVSLTGNVEWYYQRTPAEDTAGGITGIRSVISNIHIKPPVVSATNISHDIEKALVRSARVDAGHIHVEVEGSEITLSGHANSWLECSEAIDAAWRTRGVSHVKNNITIHF
jgi:osmotically-inducible protein OsmY